MNKPDVVDSIMDTVKEEDSEGGWVLMGKRVPKLEIVFFFQIILIYLVVIVCVVNLSISNGNSNLWTALLSSSLGYMLPSPSPVKKKIEG